MGSERIPNFIFSEMNTFIKKQTTLTKEYEDCEMYGMAYLASWSILERGIKEVITWNKNFEIRKALKTWLEYLDTEYGDSVVKIDKPSKMYKITTPLIVTGQSKLPDKKEISRIFPQCKTIIIVMDSSKKYRKKRNAIAHQADKLSKKVYESDYGITLKKAIEEFMFFIND